MSEVGDNKYEDLLGPYPVKGLVKEQGPRIQTTRFEPVINKSWEYEHTDSYQEVPTDYIGTAKQTVGIVSFGEGVAQPGPYMPWNDPRHDVQVEKAQEPYQNTRPVLTAFEQDLRQLINKHSVENTSNTPDLILAEYLNACLSAFSVATRQRERWYGRKTF